MYKVILIDDEQLIVEGLRRVVHWADFDCEVVGVAEDAASGAKLIRDLQPDILFTDIRMPGNDGLTMLAGLRSEFPEMQVAVLTGYRDFSYAQEAIRLGVTRFLLKPSKMDEINEALSAMTERLRQREPIRQDAGEGSTASGEAEQAADTAREGNTGTAFPKIEEISSAADTSEFSDSAGHAGSFLVKQALAFMDLHYAEKLTLQDVADACYVSQWHLSKLMNRYTGKSFYDTLNARRIEEAKRLLTDPSLKIGDIGEMVGYADTAHFARVFKKLTDMSANEYRNSL